MRPKQVLRPREGGEGLNHEVRGVILSRSGYRVVQVRVRRIGRLAGSWNYKEGMRASASTGGEGLNQRRSHLRTGARVCNDVRGPTRIWTLLVAKFASRRRHNLGDPLLKEAASTWFGGPLIFSRDGDWVGNGATSISRKFL